MLLKVILSLCILAGLTGAGILALNLWLGSLDSGLDDWSKGEW